MFLHNLRQHTLKSTLYRGKHLLDHTQMSKIQSNRSDKIFTCMQKRSCLFAQKTWMKILFQWWPAFIILFILMILGQTWFQVSFLLFLQRKSRREIWEGCWILGLFWENISHLKRCSVPLKNTETLRQKPVSSANPTASVLKTVNSTHFPRNTWIPRDIPSTQRRSYLLRFQSKFW